MSALVLVPHTPGEWKVATGYDGSRTIAIMRDFRPGIGPGDGVQVIADHDWVGSAFADQIFANAHVVAAGPALLGALKQALQLLTNTGGFDQGATPQWMRARADAVNAADAAIAKAEGR